MLKYNCIVVHYDEIGIKKNNRVYFERKLIDQIKFKLPEGIDIIRRYGKIICDLENCKISNDNLLKIKKALKNTPGIANFSFALKCELNLESVKKNILNLLLDSKFTTFKVNAKRSNKSFKPNSQDINIEIGSFVLDNFSNKKVNLDSPELTIYLEVGEKNIFVYTTKFEGIGGLAIGSSGVLLSSLSGGLDSPVASYMLMKRGCEIVFVHFLNNTLVDNKIVGKIKNIVKELANIQPKVKLYLLPFSKIQREIILKVPSKYRMIIYRIFMIKILNQISISEKAKGIITGDSIAQVASQTLENIQCIYNYSKIPIFSPLIAFNKNEIITISKNINVYDISIEPYPDCCSFMIANHPETRAHLSDIKKIMSNLDNSQELIEDIISNKEVFKYTCEF